ncbi:MAG: hypothetical protein HQ513_07175 [Rhodospirillales bacterium]|nr:hypothetical protein [Rhodospirillales bacterium]
MTENPKGVVTKIFGVVLIILGSLDMMLSWRGGMEVNPFHVGIFMGGIVLFALGAALGGSRGASRRQSDGGEKI